MADQKITQLTEDTAPALTDIIPTVEDPSGTPVTKKVTFTNVKTLLANQHVGSFTRDLTAASGDVSYTGVGFTPSHIDFHGVVGNNVASSHGFSQPDKSGTGIFTNEAIPQGGINTDAGANSVLTLVSAANAFQTAIIKSYDSDGFTLTWSKINSPTGTALIAYKAHK